MKNLFFQNEEYTRRIREWRWGVIVAACVSGATTWIGISAAMATAETSTRLVSASLYTVISVIVPILIWPEFIKSFPLTEGKERGMLILKVVIIIPFLMAISTFFSVTGIGGPVAMEIHYQATIRQADYSLSKLYNLRREEQSKLVPALLGYANSFRQQAEEERYGFRSGVSGAGPVYKAYKTIARTYEGLGKEVENQETLIVRNYKKANKTIAEMRGTVNNPSLTLQEKTTDFVEQLNLLNGIFTNLYHASTLNNVGTMNKNIEALVTVAEIRGTGKKATKQRRARNKFFSISLPAAKEAIEVIVMQLERQQTKAPAFKTIPISVAIFKYWSEILAFWALALVVDVIPLLGVMMMLITTRRIRKEMKAEEDQKEEGDGGSNGESIRKKIVKMR